MTEQELREWIARLKERRREDSEKIDQLKARINRLESKHQPEISRLQEEADTLAFGFKNYFQMASQAYDSGDGEGAAAYASLGRQLETECKALNNKANKLRDKFKPLHARLHELFAKTAENQAMLDNAYSIRKEVKKQKRQRLQNPSSVISGYGEQHLNEVLYKELSELPPGIAGEIYSIRYTPERKQSSHTYGSTFFNSGNGYRIELYELKDPTSDKAAGLVRRTITHEFGHVLYGELPGKLRGEWESIYRFRHEFGGRRAFVSDYAATSALEDFAECYRMYTTDRKVLEEFDPERYQLISQAIKLYE